MKKTINALGIDFHLTTKLIAEGVQQANNPKMYCNQFSVSVQTNRAKVFFKFSGSHNDYVNGIIDLDPEKFVLYCFISDAVAAKESFEDFCNEMGYDTDSRKAEKIYKECEKSLVKLQKIYSGDVYDLVNTLND